MRRFISVLLVLILAVPAVEAGRKRPKTGKVKDGKYLDNESAFSLALHENWKAKTFKEKQDNHIRVVFTQKKPAIPAHFQDAKEYTQFPRLVVFADTSTMGIHPFLDSLRSETYKSDQKKEILKEFDILNQNEIIPVGRGSFEAGGERGTVWKAKAPYTIEIQASPSAAGGERKKGEYGGAIFAVKHGDVIVVAGLFCEYDFFQSILTEAGTIMASLKWPETEEEPET
ncbi:MAG: hypothetical protein JSU65_09100 [Candidatus Zixiibacteriota bacterium]|nr:MAG: hypothetical protein JSU65_09100 [candidate division Zixibacteria bacterium]